MFVRSSAIFNVVGLCPFELGVGRSVSLLGGGGVQCCLYTYVTLGDVIEGSCYTRGIYSLDGVSPSVAIFFVRDALENGRCRCTTYSSFVGQLRGRVVIGGQIILVMFLVQCFGVTGECVDGSGIVRIVKCVRLFVAIVGGTYDLVGLLYGDYQGEIGFGAMRLAIDRAL